MTAATLIDRLDGVKPTGTGRWIARCPAHTDNKASLSIRELDDGRVLVHDFAGCPVGDVLAAVGLTFDDLYPPRAVDHRVRRERDPHNVRDVLLALDFEALLVACAAAQLSTGRPLSDDDRARLFQAAVRIGNAADLFGPRAWKRAIVDREDVQRAA